MPTCPACGGDNPDVARFCMTCGHDLSPGPTAQRRKLATLVFCDVSGSTALGERVDPESVREAMSTYFREMQAAIERHGGTVEKFIGDAVVAVFGVPRTHEDDALRAVRAAWEMRARMRDLKSELIKQYGAGLAVRIGVNTGEVVSGDVSSRQTVVTGDAVNVAARLEQSAPAGEILLGELTWQLVEPSVTVEAVGPLSLKGKSEPLPAYRLVGLHDRVSEGARAPLVGRTDELSHLLSVFDEVRRTNSCRLVTIVGEPGVGKSRLAAEFVAAVLEGATVLRGRCLSYGEGITYWPLGEIVRSAAGIEEADDSGAAREKLRALVGSRVDASFVTSRVAQAIGLAGGDASVEEIALASRRLLESLAADSTTVVMFDDIQWAEPALIDLIVGLPRLMGNSPIMVLCLARPELLETQPDWPAPMQLQALSTLDAQTMVGQLMGELSRDSTAARRVVEVAQGNPLFVEELVAFLQTGGAVETEMLRKGGMPPSLGAVLAARLDAVAASDRAWLEAGAVEGELFHGSAVAQLLHEIDQPHNAHLEHLLAGRFVRAVTPTLPSASAFQFHHLLMRDAAYTATAKRTRADLHERFADWLEKAAGDRLTEYQEVVAYHLEMAHNYLGQLGPVDERQQRLAKRAVTHLRPAAERALARSDLTAAGPLLRRVDFLLPRTSPDRIPILLSLAFCQWSTTEVEAAGGVLHDAATIAAAAGDVAAGWHVSVERACLDQIVDPGGTTIQQTLDVAERAIEMLEPRGPSIALTRAWRAVGDATIGLGQSARAVMAYRKSAESAHSSGDTSQEMFALQQLLIGMVFGATPVAEAMPLAREIGARNPDNLLLQASVRFSIGVHEAMQHRFKEAHEAIGSARDILTDLDLTLYLANDAIFLTGYVDLLGCEYRSVEQRVRQSLAALDRTGQLSVAASGLAVLAQAVLGLGDLDEAMALSTSSREMASDDDLHAQGTASVVQALVLCRRGQLDAAEEIARQAVALVEPSDWLDLKGDTKRVLAEVLTAAGHSEAAGECAEEALTLYTRKGNLVSARRTRSLLDELANASR